jgi:hypothetical protein
MEVPKVGTDTGLYSSYETACLGPVDVFPLQG